MTWAVSWKSSLTDIRNTKVRNTVRVRGGNRIQFGKTGLHIPSKWPTGNVLHMGT